MSKRSNRKKRHRKRDIQLMRPVRTSRDTAQNRQVESITVFWMLCTLATLCSELLYVVFRVAGYLSPTNTLLSQLTWLSLFVALLTGVAALGAAWASNRFTTVRPPLLIVRSACLIALLPILYLAFVGLYSSLG